MGRFGDLWASGRFVNLAKAEAPARETEEAAHKMKEVDERYAISEESKTILAALSSRRGQETGRWLAAVIPSQSEQQVAQIQGASFSPFDDIRALLDRLFKEFGDLVYEFNKSAVATDLLISQEKPELLKKKSPTGEQIYEGRLTTREWALVLLGTGNKVCIYLMPASVVMAFALGQGASKPFMEILHAAPGQWTIGGEPNTTGGIAPLAKELVGDLIRVASGAMSEEELFAPHSDKPQLGQNMAVGYQQQKPTAPNATQVAAAGNMDMHEACDVVDHIIEKELKQLYGTASTARFGTPEADAVRIRISAMETFRAKMLDAFGEYTTTTHSIEEAKQPVKASS